MLVAPAFVTVTLVLDQVLQLPINDNSFRLSSSLSLSSQSTHCSSVRTENTSGQPDALSWMAHSSVQAEQLFSCAMRGTSRYDAMYFFT